MSLNTCGLRTVSGGGALHGASGVGSGPLMGHGPEVRLARFHGALQSAPRGLPPALLFTELGACGLSLVRGSQPRTRSSHFLGVFAEGLLSSP